MKGYNELARLGIRLTKEIRELKIRGRAMSRKLETKCKRLPRKFYARPVLVVAKELLGKLLVRRISDGRIVARIVEVEAYGGSDDPASHAYKGITERNRVMFGKPGFAYVYFIYGNHFCLNVKAETEGVPGAVLVRAVEVIEGIEPARRNRGTHSLKDLSNGPGKLTKALRISKLENGLDLVKSKELYLCDSGKNNRWEISTSARVGIKEGVDNLWRFHIKNKKVISRARAGI
jgi:DNA-3-methyladenine glycosylase